MTLAEKLQAALDSGVRQIGQIAILPDTAGAAFALCHLDDRFHLDDPAPLETFRDPAAARDLSTWAPDGHYRFTKGELSLRTGWLLLLDTIDDVRRALDLFYPAALGLHFAHQAGALDVQPLREKLDRQTGMYRFARNLSDAGAQRLVREVCGPGNCCVKKILWPLDERTPLEDSEASRYPGYVESDLRAIPLLCREACNHFVAEARKASKAEFEAAQAAAK